MLVRAAAALGRDRPAFVIATAAARQDPDRAVATARGWFARLGLEVEELPLRTKGQARSVEVAGRAARGRFFYLCGGDPGLVASTLLGTPAWDAVIAARHRGAALAGSSAGAMALAARDATLLGIDVRTAAVLIGGEWRALGAGAVTVMSHGRERRFASGEVVDGLPLRW